MRSFVCAHASVQFKAAHNKSYATKVEHEHRFGVFQTNLAKMDELNKRAIAKGSSARYGINHLSDLLDEEFRAQYLMTDAKARPTKKEMRAARLEAGIDHDADVALPLDGAPSSIDWISRGAVTPVKNQGQVSGVAPLLTKTLTNNRSPVRFLLGILCHRGD